MSHTQKSAYYQELKAAGVKLDKTYQQYTTEELGAAIEALRALPEYVQPEAFPPEPDVEQREELPGERVHTGFEEEPLFIDEEGKEWYQVEVRKPSFPKPRGRRVLTYIDTGTVTKVAQSGQYTETFEVAGEGKRQGEIKITLPSYQVGIYKSPIYPFKIHCYNGNEGFDLEEVELYYGAADLVPEGVKRIYIENDLCYDIPTTVRAIQAEYRRNQLNNKGA
jgi:hypothetical protein